MPLADVVAILRADTSQFTAKLGAAEANVQKLSKNGASSFQKFAAVGKAALFGVATAAAGVGIASVDMAMKGQQAHAQLVNAMKNAGVSASTYEGQIQGVDAKMTKFGFTNSTTEAAIARLVTVTGNAQGSLNDMGLAADIARARHMDLNGAVDLMAKTMAGNITAAKRMGIAIPPEILKIKNPTDKANAIMAILENRFKGSAAAAAGTFSGKMAVMKAQAENLAESFGQKLIPILTSLMSTVSSVVQWFSKHQAAAIAVAGVVGGVLLGATIAWTASLFAAGGALAFITAPILGVIAGVALLAAGVFLVIKHWSAISGFFKKLWGVVEKIFHTVVTAVLGIIKGWYPLILGVLSGGVLLIPSLIFKYWSQISSDTASIINTVVGFFTALPGQIVSGLGDIVGTIWGAFSSANQWIVNNVITPVVSTFTQLPSQIVGGLGNIVGTIWSALTSSVSWIDANVLVPLVNYFTQLPGRILNGLGNIVGTIFGGLTGAAGWVVQNVIDPVANAFTGLPGQIGSVITAAAGQVGNFLGSIIDDLKKLVNEAIDWVNNHRPTIPIVNVPLFPAIPHLASGTGMGTYEGLALVGERGPELVNFGRPAQVVPNGPTQALLAGGTQPGGAPGATPSGGTVINITNNGVNFQDANQIGSSVGWALRTAPRGAA